MRSVIWTDDRGLRHHSLLREHEDDSMAPEGMPQDPPDVVNRIDWQQVAHDLHNQLVDRHLFTEADLQADRSGTLLTGAVLAALRRRVIMLYRQEKDQAR